MRLLLWRRPSSIWESAVEFVPLVTAYSSCIYGVIHAGPIWKLVFKKRTRIHSCMQQTHWIEANFSRCHKHRDNLYKPRSWSPHAALFKILNQNFVITINHIERVWYLERITQWRNYTSVRQTLPIGAPPLREILPPTQWSNANHLESGNCGVKLHPVRQ